MSDAQITMESSKPSVVVHESVAPFWRGPEGLPELAPTRDADSMPQVSSPRFRVREVVLMVLSCVALLITIWLRNAPHGEQAAVQACSPGVLPAQHEVLEPLLISVAPEVPPQPQPQPQPQADAATPQLPASVPYVESPGAKAAPLSQPKRAKATHRPKTKPSVKPADARLEQILKDAFRPANASWKVNDPNAPKQYTSTVKGPEKK